MPTDNDRYHAVILSQSADWRENPPVLQSAKSFRLLIATG